MHSSRMRTARHWPYSRGVLPSWGGGGVSAFLGGLAPERGSALLRVGRGGGLPSWGDYPGHTWSHLPSGADPPPPHCWTDKCLWKHNLRSLRYAGGKYISCIYFRQESFFFLAFGVVINPIDNCTNTIDIHCSLFSNIEILLIFGFL